ncbi:response regulator [Arcticibacter sp. MXS-1]|uniref:response regulator n=1 Tax=Arcticibacter sp. MXS-1 TaxID=3341726 RepID=UPI0035A940B7
MVKVTLAEDHFIVRQGIRALLEDQPWLSIIDEATNGNEVIEKIKGGVIPDILLTDIMMPDLDGLSLLEEVREIAPETKVLILSIIDRADQVIKAIHMGAKGYLLKSVSKEELLYALRHVMSGQPYICSELSLKFLSKSSAGMDNYKDKKPSIVLSKREKEVLHLISEGYTNKEIADMLYTSRRTVEGHRQNLIDKTNAKNTAELIKIAIKYRLIDA